MVIKIGRKIKISSNIYPTDKELYDIVMSGLISPKKVQEILVKFGIIIQSRERKALAEVLCSLFLDHEQITKLMDHTNVRENRVKTSVVELSIPGANINDVFEALQEADFPLSDSDARLKIDTLSKPTYSKESEIIEYVQPFKRIDYSKTALLQEEPNEFSINISKQSDSVVKLTCSTSNTASEFYFKSIKDEILNRLKDKKPDSDPYFREILASDIPSDKINEFFNKLIASNKLNLILSHATAIHMTKPENLTDSYIEENSNAIINDSDTDDVDQTEKETIIRQLKFQGKNLLHHQDIRNKVDEGYVIKSLEALFYNDESASVRRFFLILLGFGTANKFFSEIKTCEVQSSDSKKKDKVHLPTAERESYLSSLNTEAFHIFEDLRIEGEDSEKLGKSS